MMASLRLSASAVFCPPAFVAADYYCVMAGWADAITGFGQLGAGNPKKTSLMSRQSRAFLRKSATPRYRNAGSYIASQFSA